MLQILLQRGVHYDHLSAIRIAHPTGLHQSKPDPNVTTNDVSANLAFFKTKFLGQMDSKVIINTNHHSKKVASPYALIISGTFTKMRKRHNPASLLLRQLGVVRSCSPSRATEPHGSNPLPASFHFTTCVLRCPVHSP